MPKVVPDQWHANFNTTIC
uniref:Uncharacterized protein n=1 Tax=Macrostomum lignano TaxID=282301 RepID=A0A1I8FDN8_9PLAT